MDVGRELDAKIAEKIFGWVWTEIKFVWDEVPRLYLLPPDKDGYEAFKTTSGEWGKVRKGRILFDLPQYSKDINEAWKIVLKMKMMMIAREGQCFAAPEIDSDYSEEVRMGVIRDSIPHAVCLASLKMVTERPLAQ